MNNIARSPCSMMAISRTRVKMRARGAVWAKEKATEALRKSFDFHTDFLSLNSLATELSSCMGEEEREKNPRI